MCSEVDNPASGLIVFGHFPLHSHFPPFLLDHPTNTHTAQSFFFFFPLHPPPPTLHSSILLPSPPTSPHPTQLNHSSSSFLSTHLPPTPHSSIIIPLLPPLPLSLTTAQSFFSLYWNKQETFYEEELLRLKRITSSLHLNSNELVELFTWVTGLSCLSTRDKA